ncbi:MAG: Stp1/IreP family PP2C-type Ser/Thr phosphatase [Clostridium sp.]|uniref:Stp1/IreP family PP2C-type Ser/Thr phosphatase n=1 Tax=Clostridium culturomicium TaxID=1499683 RepID=UPI002913DC1F|nr:Stp1/IreP family PP2C-type Ser/Thr phosphatase [Clostridium sp.]MDU7083269.1 Stp1/IreP family PP2C-type Ser/Thr phosphatase [Clostridium sp.]
MGRLLGIGTDVGNKRSFNEDSVGYYEDENFGIYIVADGMGGHNAGEVASKMAKDVVINYVLNHRDEESPEEILNEALQNANRRIYREGLLNEECNGMGTTITGALLRGDELTVVNVGDSRVYVLRDGQLIKVTKDHSLVQELLDNGTITIEEAKNHPNRNVITRAVGTNPVVRADYYDLNLKNVEKVLLCSDGLTNEVSEDEILEVLKSNEENPCQQLINMSKENGGRDNISVIIFKGEWRSR